MLNYDPRRQPALTFLAIGAIIGLILGLLIGWVFWPVEWTGAALRDLYPPEKAEYIAAVADAFVIYDSPEAAEVAQRRLAAVDDGNLNQTFQDALQYFSESQFGDKAIRESNIRRLAVELNLSASTLTAEQVVAPGNPEVVTTPITDLLPTPAPVAESTGRLGWVGWLLWLLTALLLLAGGIYILRMGGLPDFRSLLKPRPATVGKSDRSDKVDEFDDYDESPSVRGRKSNTGTNWDSGVGDPFEQEEEDGYGAPPRPATQSLRPGTQTPLSGAYTRRPAATIYDTDDPDELAEKSFDEDDFADDFADLEAIDESEAFDDEDESQPAQPTGSSYSIDVSKEQPTSMIPMPPPAPSRPTPPATLPEARKQEPFPPTPRAPDPNPVESTPVNTALSAPGGRSGVARSGERVLPASRPRAKVIDQHIFHYQTGMTEYDESRPIVDIQSGKYIGEFGMGASSKNALVQTGPEQLVALEVWLFDKSDERNLGNQTRILLSEYAIDHNLEQMFLKERQDNPRPFTAQPGVHFQLESQNLLLDCTIVDVEYSNNNATKGIFQQITVDMTVQMRK